MGLFHSSAKCRLLFMLSLTTTFFMIELVVGYVTNSMALVADSFHMLSDVVALVIAYVSVRMSPKKWSKNTFGWARAEVLGALINAVFLCALCFSILVESLKRFYDPEEIHQPFLILIVGIIGFVVNIIGLLLFKGFTHSYIYLLYYLLIKVKNKIWKFDNSINNKNIKFLMRSISIEMKLKSDWHLGHAHSHGHSHAPHVHTHNHHQHVPTHEEVKDSTLTHKGL